MEEREVIMASELEQERAENRVLRRQLSELTDSLTKPSGPTCGHCRKPIAKDGDGNWRCLDFRLWCGIGDAKHAPLDLAVTQRATMVRR